MHRTLGIERVKMPYQDEAMEGSDVIDRWWGPQAVKPRLEAW